MIPDEDIIGADSGCYFCFQTGPVDIIAKTPSTYLKQATLRDGTVVDGAYQVVPYEHVTHEPFYLGRDMQHLVAEANLSIDNDVSNWTERGGRTVMGHYHRWLLDRAVIGDGLMIGMHGLLMRLGSLSDEAARLREDNRRMQAQLAGVRHQLPALQLNGLH